MASTSVKEIKTLDQLIHVGENTDQYKLPSENKKRLVQIMPSLYKLKNLVGMKNIKNQIVSQILYYLLKFNESNDEGDMLHTCIEGNPGYGKTTLGQIIGEIYCSLGILSTSKFHVVKRSDLIAGYLGQTAIKTQKVLDEAKGGVLFIDEAYSLGNNNGKDGHDSFSKECIDTLNRFLTEQKNDFVCIIAGYKDSLNKCFFSMNHGLERRFPWRYSIDDYDANDLLNIFKLQVVCAEYLLEENAIDIQFFKDNKKFFIHAGGDTETFLHKCKIYHSSRVFFLPRRFHKILSKQDIQSALGLYKENFNIQNIESNYPTHLFI